MSVNNNGNDLCSDSEEKEEQIVQVKVPAQDISEVKCETQISDTSVVDMTEDLEINKIKDFEKNLVLIAAQTDEPSEDVETGTNKLEDPESNEPKEFEKTVVPPAAKIEVLSQSTEAVTEELKDSEMNETKQFETPFVPTAAKSDELSEPMEKGTDEFGDPKNNKTKQFEKRVVLAAAKIEEPSELIDTGTEELEDSEIHETKQFKTTVLTAAKIEEPSEPVKTATEKFEDSEMNETIQSENTPDPAVIKTEETYVENGTDKDSEINYTNKYDVPAAIETEEPCGPKSAHKFEDSESNESKKFENILDPTDIKSEELSELMETGTESDDTEYQDTTAAMEFVTLLANFKVLFSKSQSSEIRSKKAKALKELTELHNSRLGVIKSQKQISKKILNMKALLKRKISIHELRKQKVLFKDWECMLHNLVEGKDVSLPTQTGDRERRQIRSKSSDSNKEGDPTENVQAIWNKIFPDETSTPKCNEIIPETDETRNLSNLELQILVLEKQIMLHKFKQQILAQEKKLKNGRLSRLSDK